YVVALYRKVLERVPDPAGYAFWTQQLDAGMSRAAVAQAFENSLEHLGLEVDNFYQTIFRRAADAAGRGLWVNALASGLSEAAVAVGFLTSGEFLASHPDNASYVNGLYQVVLQRSAADPGGLAFWLD